MSGSDTRRQSDAETLRRGCDQHGITLKERPKGQPHSVGSFERLIGIVMRMVHDEVPRTIYSHPAERGAYDSDGRPALQESCDDLVLL